MTKIIIANWKMNGSQSFIQNFFKEWKVPSSSHRIVFCPPFPYLSQVHHYHPFVGAQDCHEYEYGAFTGNVSAAMVKDVGGQYVILGHSERRQEQGETNDQVRQKAEIVLKYGLTPIICVGETFEERQSGKAIATVLGQVKASLPLSESLIIAYEPVWAIGTGLTATVTEIAAMHQAIAEACPGIPLLYGGSVTADNSAEIMAIDHVDGVLVGGASLKPNVFQVICEVS